MPPDHRTEDVMTNPDDEPHDQSEPREPTDTDHPTGAQQAKENKENELAG
jgi:hypothetical protein